jgi:hypothetical protein
MEQYLANYLFLILKYINTLDNLAIISSSNLEIKIFYFLHF